MRKRKLLSLLLALAMLASLLPLGVYAVEACGSAAVANYGTAPTMGAEAWPEPVLELHFVDAPPDAWPSRLRVELRRFIRPEAKFASVDDLRRQIALDVAATMSNCRR